MANSHATKKPLRKTNAAIAASLASKIRGGSQCCAIASAIGVAPTRENMDRFIGRMPFGTRNPLRRILPAGLGYARDEPCGSQFAKSQAGHFETADKRPPATGYLTTINDARRTGIARQLSQAGIILLRF